MLRLTGVSKANHEIFGEKLISSMLQNLHYSSLVIKSLITQLLNNSVNLSLDQFKNSRLHLSQQRLGHLISVFLLFYIFG